MLGLLISLNFISRFQNVAKHVLSHKALAYYASASDDEISEFPIILFMAKL